MLGPCWIPLQRGLGFSKAAAMSSAWHLQEAKGGLVLRWMLAMRVQRADPLC